MATQINLKIRDENGNTTNKVYEIDAINGYQFESIMKVVNSILKEMKDDQSLKGLFVSVFGEEDIREVDIATVNAEILTNAVNSFETLFITMPGKAYELLAALSGVEANLLKAQKFEDALNIYDAVLEENDIERLVSRIKKSLALTQSKMKFVKLVKKATGRETQPS